jgi:hypothetical protein
MRIDEIVSVNESYYEELLGVVQDQLSRAMAQGVEDISTPKFQKILFKLGYNASIPELIQAVDQSGFASSVDANTIRPTNQLPDDLAQDAEDAGEQEVDIGKKVNSNAAQSVKQDKF